MKKIFLSVAVLLTAVISNAQFTSAKLTAAGLTCAMCTKAIYNALAKIPFVDKVDADIKNASFFINIKSGSSADPDEIRKAVEEAGFSVARLSFTGNFSNVAIGNDAHVNIDGKTYHFLQAHDASLNGEKTLTVVDKKFLSAREFNKYLAGGGHRCLESGKVEACCPKDVAAHNGRIYHVTM